MTLEQNDWAKTVMILGLAFTVLSGVWHYINTSFKDKKSEREAKILADERHQTLVIQQAVKDGMEYSNIEIRREFKEYKAQTDIQFSALNKRIDDFMNRIER